MNTSTEQLLNIKNWEIWQDAPAYGCDDNPSYKWIAFEYIDGNWTGKSLEAKSNEEMMAYFK